MNNKSKIQKVLEDSRKKRHEKLNEINTELNKINLRLAEINKFFNEYKEKEIEKATLETQHQLITKTKHMKIRAAVGLGVATVAGIATLLVSPIVFAAPLVATITCGSVAGSGLLHFIGEFIADKLPFGRRHKLRKQLKLQNDLKTEKVSYEKEQENLVSRRNNLLSHINDIHKEDIAAENSYQLMKQHANEAKTEGKLNKEHKTKSADVDAMYIGNDETMFVTRTARDKYLASKGVKEKTVQERLEKYKNSGQKPSKFVRFGVAVNSNKEESNKQQENIVPTENLNVEEDKQPRTSVEEKSTQSAYRVMEENLNRKKKFTGIMLGDNGDEIELA